MRPEKLWCSRHRRRLLEKTAQYLEILRDTISHPKMAAVRVASLQWSKQFSEDDPSSRFPRLHHTKNAKFLSFAAVVVTFFFLNRSSHPPIPKCLKSTAQTGCQVHRERQMEMQVSQGDSTSASILGSFSMGDTCSLCQLEVKKIKEKNILSHVQTRIFPGVTCQLSAWYNVVFKSR